ncbi:MAG: dUTP diphosphatase [Clostridia bacterium]|nr:dUTP diphosphatase [Clostridia bacterium]
MQIKIKKIKENAKLPFRATNESAGLDLFACLTEEITLEPMQRAVIPTGISIEIPSSYTAFIYARSGLAVKNGITLSNCVGVIDSDYRGEICVGLINQSDKAYKIKKDERIAQLIVQKIELPEIIQVENLSETKRDKGGFGSSGRF